MEKLTIEEALCIIDVGWHGAEKELYDIAKDVIRKESVRLYLEFTKYKIEQELSKGEETGYLVRPNDYSVYEKDPETGLYHI